MTSRLDSSVQFLDSSSLSLFNLSRGDWQEKGKTLVITLQLTSFVLSETIVLLAQHVEGKQKEMLRFRS